MKTLDEVLLEKQKEHKRQRLEQARAERKAEEERQQYVQSEEFETTVKNDLKELLPELEEKVKRVCKYSGSYDLSFTFLSRAKYYQQEVSEEVAQRLCKLGYKAKLYVHSGFSGGLEGYDGRSWRDYGIDVDLYPVKSRLLNENC